MKLETFVKLINETKKVYDNSIAQDKKLENALGGDSVVMTEWISEHLEENIKIIAEDMNDTEEWIDWLFWESVCSNSNYSEFEVDGVVYRGTPKNIWKLLKNKLTKKDALYKEKKTQIDTDIVDNLHKAIKNNKSIHEFMYKYVLNGLIKDYRILDDNSKEYVIMIDYWNIKETINISKKKR